MATGTLTWSGEGESIRSENNAPKKRIRQTYQVPDALTREQAMNATGVPVFNQELVPSSPFRVVYKNAEPAAGPTNWIVTVEYEVASIIYFDDNPINGPAIFEWGRAIRTVAMDRDANDKPIRNPAGDVPNPPPTREIEFETLRITRWEAFYNREQARLFRQHTNSNVFTLGATTVRKGELLCTSILPITPIAGLFSGLVHMAYDFELCVDLRDEPTESGAPFDLHIPALGRWGWWDDSGTPRRGPIVDAKGVPVPADVVLRMNGRPMDASLKIGGDPIDGIRYAPQVPIVTPAVEISGIDYSTLVQSPYSDDTFAPVLLWRRYPQADFSVLAF